MTERPVNRDGFVWKGCREALARDVRDWESLSVSEQDDLTDRAWSIAEHHPVSYASVQVALRVNAEPREVATIHVSIEGRTMVAHGKTGVFNAPHGSVELIAMSDGTVRWKS